MADMKKTALYYPEIAIPSGKWLRQAVLYFDMVASIVPSSMIRWTKKQFAQEALSGDQIPSSIALVSEELKILESEGEYRPICPEDLVESNQPERDEFNDDFLKALECPRFQSTLGNRDGWCFDADVHARKGTPDLFSLLIDSGYAKRDPADSNWFLFERSTAHLYMSVLAKHLARRDLQDTVPSTSQEESNFRDIIFRLGDKSVDGICVGELLFKNVLPCPKFGTSISKILEFKRRRRHELLRFRQEISGLEDNLGAASQVEEIKSLLSDFADKKNSALSELRKSFATAAFEITLQSVQSLIQIRTPTLIIASIAGLAMANNLKKLSDIPISTVVNGAGIGAMIQVGLNIASGFKKRKDEMRNSAFSYVYHIEEGL